MAEFQLLYTHNGSDMDVAGYWRNVVGSPVLSASKVAAGAAGDASPIAGVYRFTFETPITVSVRRVSLHDAANPLIYSGTRSVIADYYTENINLLPGWSLIFSGDVHAGDEFEVGIGCYLDISQWHRILSFGPRLVGTVSTERTLKAKNVSAGTLRNCMAVATNAVRVENEQVGNRPFHTFVQTGLLNPDPDGDVNGVAVTFDNYAAESPAKVDILIDGAPIDVYDVAAASLVPGGKGLKCDDFTVYRFADGTKYQSGTFTLCSDMSGSDTATIYVSDGGGAVWLALDSGSFVPGVQGLMLTETGEDDGDITADGEVTFRLRITPASAATVSLNQRSFSLRLVGLDQGGDEVDLEHQGSFLVAQGDGQLLIRITATNEAYQRPRYSEDTENPGEYIPDEGGEYVEDLIDPGSFVHCSADPSNGNYGNYLDYLAANGVTFVDA